MIGDLVSSSKKTPPGFVPGGVFGYFVPSSESELESVIQLREEGRPFSTIPANGMKTLSIIFALVALSAASCEARAVRSLQMKALIQESALVFVGKVRSVEPSGMTTELTYPTWEGVVFEWLKVEVEVIDPIKGVEKTAMVRTLMLSARGDRPIINAPGMVSPKMGRPYLFCLLPTKFEGVYASVTAPFDDNEGVFLLDRKSWTDGAIYYDDKGKEVAFRKQNEKNAVLWSLVNGKGIINPEGAERMRTRYRAEIASPAPKDAVIHLRWRKEESDNGWQWNVPIDDTDSKKNKQRVGPASKR